MAQWLKQSTAATLKIGPFVDDTDGKTAETGLSIAQANIRLSKNGGDFAQTHSASGAVHDEYGYYDVPVDSTDTDTLGRLRVSIFMTGTALPVWMDFIVTAANIFDSFIGGGDFLQVDATQWLGTNILAPGVAGTPDVNAKLLGGDVPNNAPAAPTAGNIADAVWDEMATSHTGTLAINLDAQVSSISGWLDAAGVRAAIGMSAANLDTQLSNLSSDVGAIPTNPYTGTPPTAAAIADAVLDEAGAGHTGLIPTNLDAQVSTVGGASVNEIWNELIAGHLGAGTMGKALSDAGSAGDPWSAAVRTLTSSAAQTAAALTGDNITITRGDTLNVSITGLGSLANLSKLYFTVKKYVDGADSTSIAQVEKAGGLLYINGVVATPANGSLTVDSTPLGNITIVLKADETFKLVPAEYDYDIEIVRSSGTAVSTLSTGKFIVVSDVTKAIT